MILERLVYLDMVWAVLSLSKVGVAFLTTAQLLESHILEDRLLSVLTDQLKAFVVIVGVKTLVCLLWTGSRPFLNSLINLLRCPN